MRGVLQRKTPEAQPRKRLRPIPCVQIGLKSTLRIHAWSHEQAYRQSALRICTWSHDGFTSGVLLATYFYKPALKRIFYATVSSL
jgi:hypothetical protein